MVWWADDDELWSDEPDCSSSLTGGTKAPNTRSTVTAATTRRKIQIPSGMRFIPTPGNKLESAIYAIAIGYTADPHVTRPLNWSAFGMESLAYAALNSLWKTQKIKFDPKRPMSIFGLCLLTNAWNSRSSNGMKLFVVETSEKVHALVYPEGGEAPKSIFIRLKDDRWEGCGYYQKPTPTVSNSSRLTTLPVLSRNDIEPDPSTETLDDTPSPEPASSSVAAVNPSTESMIKSLRESSKGYTTIIHMLWCWTEVLDLPRRELLRPKVAKFFEKYMELMDLSKGIMDDIDKSISKADEEVFLIKWQQYLRQEMEGDVSLNRSEQSGIKQETEETDIKQQVAGDVKEEEEMKAVEQEEKEDSKQKQNGDSDSERDDDNKHAQDEDLKQKAGEDSREKEYEGTKQTESEMFKAMTISYAQQDRYDSCSDSD